MGAGTHKDVDQAVAVQPKGPIEQPDAALQNRYEAFFGRFLREVLNTACEKAIR